MTSTAASAGTPASPAHAGDALSLHAIVLSAVAGHAEWIDTIVSSPRSGPMSSSVPHVVTLNVPSVGAVNAYARSGSVLASHADAPSACAPTTDMSCSPSFNAGRVPHEFSAAAGPWSVSTNGPANVNTC